MITNKDIRVENGNLVLNGDKYPLDGQSPETIMEIVEDNSDSTPTENSTKPVKSGGIYSKIGDLTQTGLTGDSVAAQLDTAREQIETKRSLTVSSSVIGSGVNLVGYTSSSNTYITPHEGFVRFTGANEHQVCLVINGYSAMVSSTPSDYKAMWLPKGVEIFFADGTPSAATWFNCSNE